MRVSVIVSTYNSPEWLEKVVWSYSVQSHRDFELIIADDGSGSATHRLIDRMRRDTGMEIVHVWHEDCGFRKTVIMNKAIVASQADYLVFTDGDCIAGPDFLARHVRYSRPGHMLSGGIVRLPLALSRQISRYDILAGCCTRLNWLRRHGLKISKNSLLLLDQPWISKTFDLITPTRPTLNGHNASAWRADVMRANGFDERMQYGGLDRELGERLINAGVRAMQVRHRISCVHLDHPRPYQSAAIWRRNFAIRAETAEHRFKWTPHGIRKGAELLRVVSEDSTQEAATESRHAA